MDRPAFDSTPARRPMRTRPATADQHARTRNQRRQQAHRFRNGQRFTVNEVVHGDCIVDRLTIHIERCEPQVEPAVDDVHSAHDGRIKRPARQRRTTCPESPPVKGNGWTASVCSSTSFPIVDTPDRAAPAISTSVNTTGNPFTSEEVPGEPGQAKRSRPSRCSPRCRRSVGH